MANTAIEFDQLQQQLNASDEDFATALEALDIEVKDEYSQGEVARLVARLNSGKALPSSAPETVAPVEYKPSAGEPDSRVFGPPHPGLDEEIPIQTLKSSSLILFSPNTLVNCGFRFDAEEHAQTKQDMESQVVNDLHTCNDSVKAYARSRKAQVLADIDMAAACLRANGLAELAKPQTL